MKHILIFKTGFSNTNQEFCLPPPYTALTYALNFILKRKPFVQRLCCLKLKLVLELCRFFSRFKIGKLLVSSLFTFWLVISSQTKYFLGMVFVRFLTHSFSTIKWQKNFMKLIFFEQKWWCHYLRPRGDFRIATHNFWNLNYLTNPLIKICFVQNYDMDLKLGLHDNGSSKSFSEKSIFRYTSSLDTHYMWWTLLTSVQFFRRTFSFWQALK